MSAVKIIAAGIRHLDEMVPLFDQYRQFYRQESALDAARDFLAERLRKGESLVYLAYKDDTAVGFMQLYKTFSSVTLEPIYILNDLYVLKAQRSKGIGSALLQFAKSLC